MSNQKETRSMYLYAALIFVVALLLILLAFFGQTNISRLGNRANEIATTQVPQQTQTPQDAELARISNMAAALDSENKALKAQMQTYEKIFQAYSYASDNNISEASSAIAGIDPLTLGQNEKVLYDEIINIINKGEKK